MTTPPGLESSDLLDWALGGWSDGRTVSTVSEHALPTLSEASRRRVDEVLAGRLQMRDLDQTERKVFNAELGAAIAAKAASTSLGDLLAAEGINTVALENAALTEFRPGMVTLPTDPH